MRTLPPTHQCSKLQFLIVILHLQLHRGKKAHTSPLRSTFTELDSRRASVMEEGSPSTAKSRDWSVSHRSQDVPVNIQHL